MTLTREAKQSDLPQVLALLRASPEAAQWNEAQLATYAGSEKKICFVALDASDAMLGFLAATTVAGEAELENIAVTPEWRRRGTARLLVGTLSAKWKTIRLEVRSQNSAAIAAYARLGFTRDGVRRGYYSNPDDDAVLMTLRA